LNEDLITTADAACPVCGRVRPFYHCDGKCQEATHRATCLNCKTLYQTTLSPRQHEEPKGPRDTAVWDRQSSEPPR